MSSGFLPGLKKPRQYRLGDKRPQLLLFPWGFQAAPTHSLALRLLTPIPGGQAECKDFQEAAPRALGGALSILSISTVCWSLFSMISLKAVGGRPPPAQRLTHKRCPVGIC